jgi:hypothetical protein
VVALDDDVAQDPIEAITAEWKLEHALLMGQVAGLLVDYPVITLESLQEMIALGHVGLHFGRSFIVF